MPLFNRLIGTSGGVNLQNSNRFEKYDLCRVTAYNTKIIEIVIVLF